MSSSVRIRPEQPQDHEAVFVINQQAFDTDAEARLVAALRPVATPLISLVAEKEEVLVGHILFSPVTVESNKNNAAVMGLGPMAVLPDFQNHGIGSQLIEAGLDACRELGIDAMVVLGHPEYYPRFGFQAAPDYDLHYQSSEFDSYFMVMALRPGALDGLSGFVQYHPVFELV